MFCDNLIIKKIESVKTDGSNGRKLRDYTHIIREKKHWEKK